jgi:hypothetical protein
LVTSEIIGTDTIESSARAPVKRLDDPKIALAGGGGVVSANELIVQTLQQLGHRQYLL